jgi:aryl-alcohol dehydrogenase-like predicted oxidoreductase
VNFTLEIAMEMRNLGCSGIRVAPLAFGGNVFGWTVDEESAFALLDKFTEAGFNLIDTADVYSRWVPGHSGGESEVIIGEGSNTSAKAMRPLSRPRAGWRWPPTKRA